MLIDLDDIKRAEVAGAAEHAAIADSLRTFDWSSPASARPLAGGQLVITGPGFYVNRALAVGLTAPMNAEDFDMLEERCGVAGVPAEAEVCPWADPSVLELAAGRGYRPAGFSSILVRPASASGSLPTPARLDIRLVESDEDFEAWHTVTVAGFGQNTSQQAVSRRWGQALRLLGGARLLVARLAGAPVAVASLATRDGVALLGGMTTIPGSRGKGLQQALIAWRLERGRELGCAVAASTAHPGSVSERNLQRRGFAIVGTKLGVTR